MNKPKKMAKGQYYKSGGKVAGGNSDEEGAISVGTKIEKPGDVDFNFSGDPSTQVGKYQFEGGQISDKPVLDDRGFLGKLFRPNTANDINQQLALEKAVREDLIPLIAKEEESKQGVITKSVLERLKGEQALKEPYQPVVNMFNEPGEVPFNYAGDPSALITDREKQPYVPINPASVQGNLAQQQDLAATQRANRLATVQESQLAMEERKMKQPNYQAVGNAFFKIPPDAEPSLIGTFQPGYDSQPTVGIGPDGKPTITGYGSHVPGRFESAPKRVGNMYGPGGGGTTPPILNEGYGPLAGSYGYGPASTQQNEFVDGLGEGGGTPVKSAGPLGGAPRTQRSIGTPRFEGGKLVAPIETKKLPPTPEDKELQLKDALEKLRQLMNPYLQHY